MSRCSRVPVCLAFAVALAVALAGCGGDATPPPTATPTATPAPESPVVGVVVAIDSAGLADVRGFTLRLGDGTELAFVIGRLENGAEFPPGHLTEHLASAEPVRVSFRVEGGQLVVYRIEDAG